MVPAEIFWFRKMSQELSERLNAEMVRIRIFLGVIVVAFLFLVGVLWKQQVVRSKEHLSRESRQSIRRVRLPAVRGVIEDRYGRCLARNRPSYCVAIFVEELRQRGRLSHTVDAVEAVVARLSIALGLPPEVDREDVARHLQARLPIPFIAWRGVGNEALARWVEGGAVEAGVDVYVEPVREYPQGDLMGHILGYVGRADPPSDGQKYHYYVPEMQGKSGVEKTFDDVLCGASGGQLLRVDASGFRHEVLAMKPPTEGRSVRLSVDVEIQRAVEESIKGERAAIVVMSPENGDVLAMASAPSFDPNLFCPSISTVNWNRLNTDARKPLFNRAVSGIYPPGSTFKPVVALAAVVSGLADAGTRFDCIGYYELGKTRFHCWHKAGHGSIAMRKAIEQSCNTYFCALGVMCGYDHIHHMARSIGFGERTGIELPGEHSGLLPDDAWKRRVYKDRWRSGDTCNLSIGQGALSVTPLQMGMFMAALANGGTVYRPRLVLDGSRDGDVLSRLSWSPEALSVVRNGMYDVVQAPSGTGKYARVPGTEMAGKTGTAEYGSRSNRHKHTWMTAYFPFHRPRYAVALVVEDGLSGGRTCAPRIKALVSRILEIEQARRDGTSFAEGKG